jgi:iron complex outermembrane recepter protein
MKIASLHQVHHGRTRRWPQRLLLAAISFGGVGYAISALAETEEMEAIVVTAQKREQKSQDVGISLDVFGGKQLQEMGVLNATDVAKLTPGAGTSGSYAGQNLMFTIRGVVQQDFAPTAESPIAVYVDEGYLAGNNVSGVGLFDVDRVEVLKGPQGTLFGRNATGGLVSIETRKPTKDFEADSSFSYGNFGSVRADTAVGGPLADNVQARVAVMYQKNDGWLTNISPTGGDLGGQEVIAGRVHLAIQATDKLNFLISAFISDTSQSWGPYTVLSTRSTISASGVPNAIIVNQNTGFGQPPSDYQNLTVNAAGAKDHGSYNNSSGVALHVDYDIGVAQITSITDFKELNFLMFLNDAASAVPFFDSRMQARVANLTEELRLYKDFGGTRLTTGLYYLHIDAASQDLEQPFGLAPVQVYSPSGLTTNSTSGFAQVEHDLNSQFTLQAGFRATRELKDYVYDAFYQQYDNTPVSLDRSYRGSLSEGLYSWKLQAEYRPVTDVLFFLGYSRGTKAGSFNVPFAGSAIPPDAQIPYKPEKLDSFELGAKTTLMNGHATLNASVFHYIYHDYQAYSFVDLSSLVTNNPATETGGEVEFNIRPVTGLEFMVGGSYIDASVKNVRVSNVLGAAVLDRRPPYTPKTKLLASARYTLPFPIATGSTSLQVDATRTGDSYFSLTNFDDSKIDAYTVVDSRIAWTSSNKKWELAIFGKNVTDKRYRTVGFDASDFGGFTQAAYGMPRTYGFSVSDHY